MGSWQGRCVSCGARDAPVRYRLRWWVIAAIVAIAAVIGWWLGGFAL
jgi:hypothetical protein